MTDPLGPSILSACFLFIASLVYALNAALPHIDESELLWQSDQGSAQARRTLRLLTRFDKGFGEIRMTYALLLCASYASLLSWFCPALSDALSLPPLACALLVLIPFFILAFTLTAIIPGGIACHAPNRTVQSIGAPTEWAIMALVFVLSILPTMVRILSMSRRDSLNV